MTAAWDLRERDAKLFSHPAHRRRRGRRDTGNWLGRCRLCRCGNWSLVYRHWCRCRSRAGALSQSQQHRAGGNLVANIDTDLLNDTGSRCRNRADGFVGFQFQNRLILLNRVTGLDQNVDHHAAVRAFAQVGKSNFHCDLPFSSRLRTGDTSSPTYCLAQ